jgi:hypothetical protein
MARLKLYIRQAYEPVSFEAEYFLGQLVIVHRSEKANWLFQKIVDSNDRSRHSCGFN